MTATAEDQGKDPNRSIIDLEIKVVESHKKAPTFAPRSSEPIYLEENFNDFDASIVKLEAFSNIEGKPNVNFELVIGRTEQTNKMNTFR